MAIEDDILSFALQNAIKFDGKANESAVLGKILSENADARKNAGEIKSKVSAIVAKVNSMPKDAQLRQLQELAPHLLEEKKDKKEEKDVFAFLGIRLGDYVATAFPPEPSKYPHIGHAKAILLNYMLARKYSGTFYLRFEDTNPELAQKEFYDIHLENYRWLGIEPDQVDHASSHMEEFYIFAEELVKKGKAYVCMCSQEEMREKRAKGEECNCRIANEKDSLRLWQDMFIMKEGQAVLRMKIDLQHLNTTMRDPVLMRIIEHEHPITGKKYRLWPNYDFENSIMDGLQKITHRLRTKEFELRNELQRHIQKEIGFAQTKIAEFARFNLEGVESSGRVIRDMIAKGELVGWDDPSLTTLVALRRRGFVPQAIKNFVISTGITKAEATLTWDDLIVQNRRILDSSCNRYFFVEQPVELIVSDAPLMESHLKLHPDHAERGTRNLASHGLFYIAKNDHEGLKDGELYRLMDCLNFTKSEGKFIFDSKEHAVYKERGKKIMHWLPSAASNVKVEVLMPDKTIKEGLAEPGITALKIGDIIQFERFGFCRLDKIEDGVYYFWYTHK